MKADDLTRLKAVRDRLDAVLKEPETSARDLATCSREYRLLLTDIRAQSGNTKGSVVDEISKRRAKREGTA